jgi:hypothetical protein
MHIKELATLSNIEAFCAQDSGLAEHNFRIHSREFLTKQIFKHGQRCFVDASKASQGMYFLMKLLNITFDDRLAVHKNYAFDTDLQAGVNKFVAIQARIAAPMLTLGKFDQHTPPFPSSPITPIVVRDGVEACDIFDVEFRHRYFRSSVNSSQTSVYAGRTSFSVRVFNN